MCVIHSPRFQIHHSSYFHQYMDSTSLQLLQPLFSLAHSTRVNALPAFFCLRSAQIITATAPTSPFYLCRCAHCALLRSSGGASTSFFPLGIVGNCPMSKNATDPILHSTLWSPQKVIPFLSINHCVPLLCNCIDVYLEIGESYNNFALFKCEYNEVLYRLLIQ